MPDTMRAVLCRNPGELEIVHYPVPDRKAGEALVKIRRIGVCGTDLHAFAGRQPFFSYPRVLGHELGVEVVAVGDEVTVNQPVAEIETAKAVVELPSPFDGVVADLTATPDAQVPEGTLLVRIEQGEG